MSIARMSLLFLATSAASAQDASLLIDATDLPRGLLSADLRIDLDGLTEHDGRVTLRYPQWVPGVHAPGGPIQNLAGLTASTAAGDAVSWRRVPGDVFGFLFEPPADAKTLVVNLRYIANQPTANSRGIDSYGASDIGFISPNTVLLVPESQPATEWTVDTTLSLPDGWVAHSALTESQADDGTIHLGTTTAMHLVDTPIMIGAYAKTYPLSLDAPEGTVPHDLHVFSEVRSATDIGEDVLMNYRAMVTQATHLFGSHPFADYDVLLATSDVLGRNGLEHLRSSFNIIPLETLDTAENLTGWDRMLIPHEYVHAWCGKYRRPAGMLTQDFRSPKDTELLWVYEGLTQYLGELLEIRSGMGSLEDYEWTLLTRLRWAKLQQGRGWRPLNDTTSSSHLLRGGSRTWGDLRRGQDYYAEGALIWMEADAIIRSETDGARSLDDFVQAFFKAPGGDVEPRAYDREEVIKTLEQVHPRDWDGFFAERAEQVADRPSLNLANLLGYTVQFTNKPPRGPEGQRIDPMDARDSLGISVASDGRIRSVLLGSPADRAGLAPNDRITGIDGYVWSRQRFADAIEQSVSTGGLEILLQKGDRLLPAVLEYEGGPRYMTLVRDPDAPHLLSKILSPQ